MTKDDKKVHHLGSGVMTEAERLRRLEQMLTAILKETGNTEALAELRQLGMKKYLEKIDADNGPTSRLLRLRNMLEEVIEAKGGEVTDSGMFLPEPEADISFELNGERYELKVNRTRT